MSDLKQNQKVLKEFLQRADKKLIYHAGMVALTLLTEELPADKFEEFLQECIAGAVSLNSIKLMGLQDQFAEPDETTEEPEAP